MGQGINTLSLELDDKEALALAQFVKRLTWSDLRGCAVDDDEAYVIKDAVDKLQRAMAEEGFSPRLRRFPQKGIEIFECPFLIPSHHNFMFLFTSRFRRRRWPAAAGDVATQTVVQVH